MHEELALVSGHICNGLFSVGEDGFRTRKIARFGKLFRKYQDPERKLLQLRDHSCTKNT